MDVFSKQISEFQKTGTYNYEFDEGGNLTFNKNSSNFSQHYISLPIISVIYDNVKIKSFYDIEFKEFVPVISITPTVASQENLNLIEENQLLKDKLEALTQISDANITDSERLNIKQVIIGLRIQLKQGVAERDFSEEFPYLPLVIR